MNLALQKYLFGYAWSQPQHALRFCAVQQHRRRPRSRICAHRKHDARGAVVTSPVEKRVADYLQALP